MAVANAKFQIKKPALNGQSIIEPEYQQIIKELNKNINLFNSPTTVFGRSLKEIRNDVQSEISEMMGIPKSQSFISTGHQPVFHHCGILAKFFLAHKLANEVSGKVYNFIIDTDTITPVLSLPGKNENGNTINHLPLLVDKGKLPAEFQPSPSSWELKRFRDIFDSEYIMPKYQDVAEKLVCKIELLTRNSKTISELISRINLDYARQLGLDRYDIPASKLSETASFTSFVFNLASNPYKTWQSYNDAIDLFEKTEHPHKSPIPRLKATEGSLELPFWMTLPGNSRMPMYIRLSDLTLTCGGENEQILGIQLPESTEMFKLKLEDISLRIRPKAVTFTCFTRLFFADYFIHGIGGAFYDKVTDNFIRNYFDIEIPFFCCTSATVLPDFANKLSTADAEKQLNKMVAKLRDFECNPQRYVSFEDNTTEVADLLRQKMILVEKSNLFRETRAARHEREVVFNEIKEINIAICNLMPDIRKKIEAEVNDSKKQFKSAQAGEFRELFFGLFDEQEITEIFRNI